jgi:hypothetical protein
MAKDKINETANAVSSRSRGGKFDKDKTKQQQGTARENDFLNFLVNKIGDIEDVSISINGDKRIPIKDLKKKIKKDKLTIA